MRIENFTLDTEETGECIIDMEVYDIIWDNDSIGWYEYGSIVEFDRQEPYISDFEIEDIIVDGVKVDGATYDKFYNLLICNDELIKKIEEMWEEEVEANRIDHLISNSI